MSNVFWLDRGVMYGPHVGLCLSESDFVQTLRKFKIPYYQIPEWIVNGKDGTAHSISSPSGDMVYLVCIRSHKKERRETDSLLVHEAVHVWRNFTEYIGEETPSSEFEAYGIQTLSLKLFEAYDKMRGKKA